MDQRMSLTTLLSSPSPSQLARETSISRAILVSRSSSTSVISSSLKSAASLLSILKNSAKARRPSSSFTARPVATS
jgi:hypothetical protein